MIRRALASIVTVLALAACGATAGESGGGGDASLWVTHDRGADAVLAARVPSGLTVLQALDRKADIETRYGGRFVQSIDGVSGSLAQKRDWFYFVNGIEPDVGAAEIRLHPGDVAWWDFRSWQGRMQQQPVVVGAFPEPFVHGFDGARRPVRIDAPPELSDAAGLLVPVLELGAGATGEPNVFVLAIDEGATGAALTATRGSANDSPVTFRLAGSEAAVRAAAATLAADPSSIRYRYTARFDEAGRVVG